MKVKSETEVTPSDHMDCSPPGPSVHSIFQARVLEWVAIAFSIAVSTKDPITVPEMFLKRIVSVKDGRAWF